MIVSFRCAGPRKKMPGERTRFAFLGQSPAVRLMTAENELEQPSGSGRSSMLALRKTLSWTSVTPSCMSLDAWLTASGGTSEVVWRQFDLLAGRQIWLSCSEPAAVRWKSRPLHRRVWRYSSPVWKRRYCKPLSEPSRQLAECAHYAGRVCGSCTPGALATSLAWQSNHRWESIVTPGDFSFGATCSLLPATSTSWMELRWSAKDDDIRLVCVEL